MEVSAITNTSSYVQLLVGLLLVVGLILLLAWLAKKYSLMTPGMSGAIQILSGISLGNRDRLILVEVGEKHLLLGVSPGRINTLQVFDKTTPQPDNELVDSSHAIISKAGKKQNSQFSTLLTNLVAGGDK